MDNVSSIPSVHLFSNSSASATPTFFFLEKKPPTVDDARIHSFKLRLSEKKRKIIASLSIMLSAKRSFAALYLALFIALLTTLPSAYAAADTKVANRTIERVSSSLLLGHEASTCVPLPRRSGWVELGLMHRILYRPSNYARTLYFRPISTKTCKTGTSHVVRDSGETVLIWCFLMSL